MRTSQELDCRLIIASKNNLLISEIHISSPMPYDSPSVPLFRGFNKHRRPTKHVGYFAQRSRLLFSFKLEAGNKVLN